MKLFIFMLTLLSSIVSQGGTVNLAWDWTSDPSGIYFKLFKKQLASVYDYQSPEWTGTSTTASATINTGTNYCFVVRAARTSPVAESPDSNEVCLQKPKVKPPTGFRLADFKMTVDLANNLALVNAVYTNDFGYHITSQFYQTALLNQKELEDDQQ